MTQFSTRIESSDVVGAPREAIFAVLQDPDLLAELTPLVESIVVVDDSPRWRWQLAGISALGTRFHPCFTVAMRFTGHERIDFHHDPPSGAHEHAAAEGTYVLDDVDATDQLPDGGTRVAIQLDVHVELPLPRMSRRAVEGVMHRTTEKMGERFAVNLRRHLGVRR